MAHNLNIKANGEASFFSVKQKAWHGLGTILDAPPTSEEALKFAGLDYEVVKEEMFTKDGKTVPNRFVTVRQDTRQPLGVVGNRYEVLQNRDSFKFFDAIVGDNQAIYETAGALGDGETTFITAKLPSYIQVGKGDGGLIENYIFLTNNHAGMSAVKAAFTPVRIVCNNTLNAALKDMTNSISLKHNPNITAKLEEAHKLMGMVNLYEKELSDVFNMMAKKRITEKGLIELITLTIGSPEYLNKAANELPTKFVNTRQEILAYAEGSPTQSFDQTKGTIFGAYNAITGYFQNVKEFKTENEKVESLLDGTASNYGQKMFDLCLTKIK